MAGSDLGSAEIAAADKTLFLWGYILVQRLKVKQRDKAAKYERIDGGNCILSVFRWPVFVLPCPMGVLFLMDGGAWVRSGWLDAR